MEKIHRQTILACKKMLMDNVKISDLRNLLQQNDVFTNNMLDDIYTQGSQCCLFDEIVTRGPEAFFKFINILKETGYEKIAQTLVKTAEGHTSLEPCYKMNSEPLGYCLIINNVDFIKLDYKEDDEHRCRHGSDVDEKGLREVFTKIGFEVEPEERNLIKVEMEKRLIKFAATKEWKDVDSCIIVIMSHGFNYKEDVVFGTDYEEITKNEIIDLFNNTNCPDLQNKPKMFFFQSCRGDDEDSGAGVIAQYYSDKQDATDSCVIPITPITTSNLPTLSDIFIVHTSLPKHKSYRYHETGSWFFENFIQVLKENYLYYDFVGIFNAVQALVEKRTTYAGKKQSLHLELLGTKAKVYFKKSGS